MDIVIVAQYMRDLNCLNEANSRFWFLARLLTMNGHTVEIVTSDFFHEKKAHFVNVVYPNEIKITLCHEPGYKKNICLKRVVSHKKLSNEIKKYLNCRKKPDIIYVAVPSLSVSEACLEYCNQNRIPFVVDIQDLWPEAFKMVLKMPIINDLIFLPMMCRANRIYRKANGIVAVSESYLNRASSKGNSRQKKCVAYLGTESKVFSQELRNKSSKNKPFIIGYVGRLSESYDLITAIDAISKINSEIKLLVMGDGPLKSKFELYAKRKGVHAEFLGNLPYSEMIKHLVKCDIAINPIKQGSAGSIINKVADYAMAGLPVINSQESKEYRELLRRYGAGINCKCGSSSEMAKAIEWLIDHPDERLLMSQKSFRLGIEHFDREKSYKNIIELIESVVND